MKVYVGIDLHSSNNFIAIIDGDDKRLYGKRHPNQLDSVLSVLDQFKDDIHGIVIESTYNWYWLVDGLREAGYTVHLANPSAIQQFNGLKYTDDESDAFWLANMLRLNILPTGFIYPKEERSTRDLLRRRLLFVKHKTAYILSFQSMVTRLSGTKITTNTILKLHEKDIITMFKNKHDQLTAQNIISTIKFLDDKIKNIEKAVKSFIKYRDDFKNLQSIPGIGDILAFTIILEVGTISRFSTVGDYVSYCRCATSKKISNNKKKGENNRKNGNKHLARAYTEAANFAVRYNQKAQRFFQRKFSKTGKRVVAVKALSSKLVRASYYIMRDGVLFDDEKLFS